MIRKLSWPPDVTVGVVSGLLGAGYVVGAMQITPDPSPFNVMGPRVAPMTIGIATVLCSVALITQGLRSRSRPETSAPDEAVPDEAAAVDVAAAVGEPQAADSGEASADEPQRKRSLRRVLVTFALFTAYILVFIPLGYLVSTFAFLVALTTYADPGRWIRNIVFAAAFAGVVYVSFTRGLRVDLPPGLFG